MTVVGAIVAALLAHAAAPDAAPAVDAAARVVVLDVAGAGVDATLGRAATAALAEALGSRAVTEKELAAWSAAQKARATLDCTVDAGCLAELSQWAHARYAIAGTLGRVGRTLTLTLSLTDANAVTVVGRVAIGVDSDTPTALRSAAREGVARLLGAGAAPRFAVSKGERASYAVLPLELQKTEGVDPGVARSLTDILAMEIKRVDGTTVVGIDDVAAMVSTEQKKSVLICSDDASCLAEIGAALDVDRLVVSSVGKVAGTWVVSARLLDVKNVRVLSRVSESFAGPSEQLLHAVRHCARGLLGVAGDESRSGALVVSTPEVGARVYLDGEERARTPTPPITGVHAGRHALRVVQDGFFDWQGDVYVDDGETSAQWVELTEKPRLLRPFLPSWSFYALGGIAGAGLVGAGVAGALTAWSQSEYAAAAKASVHRSVDGESVLMPLWHRSEAFATTATVLLAVGGGASVITVAAVPVVDFSE